MMSKEYPSYKYRDSLGYPVLKFVLPVLAIIQMAMITIQVFTHIRASPEPEFFATRWILLLAFIFEIFAFLATCILTILVFYSYNIVNLSGTARESHINNTGVFTIWPMLKLLCVLLIILLTFLLFIDGLFYGGFQAFYCASPGCADLMYQLMFWVVGTIVIEIFANVAVLIAMGIEYFWINPKPEKSASMMSSAVQGNRFAWGKIFTTLSALLSVIIISAMFFIAYIFWGWEEFGVFYTKMGVTTNIALASGIITFAFLFAQLITLALSVTYSPESVTKWWHLVCVGIICLLYFIAHFFMFAWHLGYVTIFCHTDLTCDGVYWQTFVTVALFCTLVPTIIYLFAGVIFYWGDEMKAEFSKFSRKVSRKKATN